MNCEVLVAFVGHLAGFQLFSVERLMIVFVVAVFTQTRRSIVVTRVAEISVRLSQIRFAYL